MTLVRLSRPTGAQVPDLGLSMPFHGAPLEARPRKLLRAARPAFLRVEVAPGEEAQPLLEAAGKAASTIGTELEAVLLADEPEEARDLARAAVAVEPARVLVVPRRSETTAGAVAEAVRRETRSLPGPVPVGGGTDRFFAHLNRSRLPVDELDFLAYAISPQVHASDDRSVMDSLEVQGKTVETAHSFARDLPIHVGPVSLRMRYDPDAGARPDVAPPAERGELPDSVDSRQVSLLCAAWTLGSIAELARAGAAAITLFETIGWRGILEGPQGSPPPFPALPGMVFPVYHVVADVCDLRAAELCVVEPAAQVRGIAARTGDRLIVLLANCSAEPVDATVDGLPAGRLGLRTLDLSTVRTAMRDPFKFRSELADLVHDGTVEVALGPYATARLEARLVA